jgi:hypothetical protein
MCCFEFLFGPSPFRRTWDGERPPPPCASPEFASKYIVPQEVYDEGEKEWLKEVLNAELETLKKRIPKGSGVMTSESKFADLDAGLPLGLLHGKVIINNSAALPQECRVGLFKKDTSFPCVARLHEVTNLDAGLFFAGLAVKIRVPDSVPNMYASSGVGNEVDLLFRENDSSLKENPDMNRFFIDSGLEFRLFQYIGTNDLSFLKSLRNWGIFLELLGRMKTSKFNELAIKSRQTGYTGKSWGGLAPFRLGPGVCRYYALPCQTDDLPLIGGKKPKSKTEVGSGLKKAFDKSKPFQYDLYVQVATNDCVESDLKLPPEVLAAESAWARWNPTKAPAVKVGLIEFPANAFLSDELVPGHKAPLQFSAFNQYKEMEPIGHCMRFRKHVHTQRSNLRMDLQFEVQGGATFGKCPFVGA